MRNEGMIFIICVLIYFLLIIKLGKMEDTLANILSKLSRMEKPPWEPSDTNN